MIVVVIVIVIVIDRPAPSAVASGIELAASTPRSSFAAVLDARVFD